jgi:hypothetical protein
MARRGILGSTLAVFLIATFLFFCMYFFMPDLADRVLGVSFHAPRNSITARVINEATGLNLKDSDVKAFTELINLPGVREALSSEEIRSALGEGEKLTREGYEKLQMVLSSSEVKKEIDSYSGSISKKDLDKVAEKISDSAEAL